MPSTMLLWDCEEDNNPAVKEDSTTSDNEDWLKELAEVDGNDADKLVSAICTLFACENSEVQDKSQDVFDALEMLRDNVPKIVSSISQVDMSAANARVAISKTRMEEASLRTRAEELESKLNRTETTNARQKEINDLVLAVSKQQSVSQLNAEIERLEKEIADTESRVKEQNAKYEQMSKVCASFFDSLEELKAVAQDPVKASVKEPVNESLKAPPVKKLLQEPMEELLEEPVRESFQEPMEESLKDSMEESLKEPVKESVEEQVNQEASKNGTPSEVDVKMEPIESVQSVENGEKQEETAKPNRQKSEPTEDETVAITKSEPIEEDVAVKKEKMLAVESNL